MDHGMYTVQIETSADGVVWQSAHPSETVQIHTLSPDDPYWEEYQEWHARPDRATATMESYLQWLAGHQNWQRPTYRALFPRGGVS